jgi:hypothetical protein
MKPRRLRSSHGSAQLCMRELGLVFEHAVLFSFYCGVPVDTGAAKANAGQIIKEIGGGYAIGSYRDFIDFGSQQRKRSMCHINACGSVHAKTGGRCDPATVGNKNAYIACISASGRTKTSTDTQGRTVSQKLTGRYSDCIRDGQKLGHPADAVKRYCDSRQLR